MFAARKADQALAVSPGGVPKAVRTALALFP